MVRARLNEDDFWKWSPAAEEIFAYRDENQDVNTMPWGFDHGGVSDDSRINWVSFSCTRLSGNKDKLTISALKNEDGSWQIKHEIKRAS